MTDDDGDGDHDSELSTRRADVIYEVDDDERHSDAVVRAVASLTDTAVLDLDPLYDVIDPEHLDGLFDATGDDGTTGRRSTTFAFGECQVTVTPEDVRVRERRGDSE